MGKADTWMPWYVADYLADTMHLTTEQHGAYCLLLMAAWKSGGTLPSDDTSLSAITRMTAAKWREAKPKLIPFFQAGDGVVTHARVMKEHAKAQAISETKRTAGKASAAKRWQDHSKPIAHATTDAETPAQQSQWQNDTPSQSPSPKPLEPLSPVVTTVGGTEAGMVCLAMRKSGVANTNPSDPRLLALLADGATVEEFAFAADAARGKGNGFAYALATVKNNRAQAAEIAANPGRAPPKNRAQTNAETIAALTGGLASPKVPYERVIDSEATRID